MESQQDAGERIHHHLKKASPAGVHKARKIFSFRYHKLVIFALFIAVAFYVFTQPQVIDFISNLQKLSYPGVFLSGILLVFGLTAPFSIGFFLNVSSHPIILAALIGGLGATVADLFIFKVIKFSFADEIKEIEKTKAVQEIEKIFNNNRHIRVKHYLLYLFSGLMIASPLPDDVGVSILAGLTTVKPLKLALIGFVLHTSVIFSLIYFGTKII